MFIHIPEIVGTSILSAIGKRGEKGRDHISWQIYKKSDKKKFDSYYEFVFVRNPCDRALSAYSYTLSGGNQGKQDLAIAKEMAEYSDFDDFVARGLWQGAFRSHLLFLSQPSFVMDGNETLMVDFLGHFETLDKDFQQVANKLGINGEIAHRNKGSDEAGGRHDSGDPREAGHSLCTGFRQLRLHALNDWQAGGRQSICGASSAVT